MITSIDQPLAQQIVNTVKDVCGHHINFIDRTGIIFASTDEKRIGSFHEIGLKAAQTETMIEVNSDDTFSGTKKGVNLPIHHKNTFIAVIGISGTPEEVRKYAYLAERITSLLIRERELDAFSRSIAEKRHYIIHSLISREPVNHDYLMESLKELKIDHRGKKRLILIRIDSRCSPAHMPMPEKKIEQMFEMAEIRLYSHRYPGEYLAVMDENDFLTRLYILRKFSGSQKGVLNIAVGKSCHIFSLADSYESGIIALKSLTSKTDNFVIFDNLTLELILSSLTLANKEEFLQKTISQLDDEALSLLSVYYEEDMSLLHTCERLYLHKNTLQYKLDKIHRISGLNPRKFRDAVILYLAVRLDKE